MFKLLPDPDGKGPANAVRDSGKSYQGPNPGRRTASDGDGRLALRRQSVPHRYQLRLCVGRLDRRVPVSPAWPSSSERVS
jgi:hypothetical protein